MTTPTYYAVNKMGYNKADGTLVALTPPPRLIEPIHAAETNFYGDSASQFNGLFSTVLEWSAVNTAERVSLLTQLGVSTLVASNQITISLDINRLNVFSRYNAVANYSADEVPTQVGWQNLKIILSWLEAST